MFICLIELRWVGHVQCDECINPVAGTASMVIKSVKFSNKLGVT